MTDYEKAVAVWQKKNISTDAELAEALNGFSISFAYHSGKIENIHPFADGNGRVGRLAMNYFLITHDHPAITIHEEDRKNYYTALEAWDRRQELDILKKFLREQTVKTWEKQIARAEKH